MERARQVPGREQDIWEYYAKNPAAVALGRRGGKARAKKMTPEERVESARKAVQARWSKTKEPFDPLVKLKNAGSRSPKKEKPS